MFYFCNLNSDGSPAQRLLCIWSLCLRITCQLSLPATSENLIIIHQGLYVHIGACITTTLFVAKVRTWPHLGNIATQHVCKKPQVQSCSLKLLNWDANKSWIRAVPFLLVSSFGSLVCFPEGIAIWHAFWVMPVFSMSSFKINREQLRPTRCWANQLDFLGFSSSSSAFGVDKAWREELENNPPACRRALWMFLWYILW